MAATNLVFFDSSALIAASISPTGGFAVALDVFRGSRFRAVIARQVIGEVTRNIRVKFGDDELLRFYQLLVDVKPRIVGVPTEGSMDLSRPVTSDSDAPVSRQRWMPERNSCCRSTGATW